MRFISPGSFSLALALFVSSVAPGAVWADTAAAQAQAAEKEWTFLIFLNGKNNLDPFGFEDLNEMERVGSTDQVNVVAQWGSLRNGDVRRVLVQKDSNPAVVTSPTLQNLGQLDMGDWQNLVAFIEWGVKAYPAKRYFINLWDHGSGWHELAARRRGAPAAFSGGFQAQDISHDEETGNVITTEQLSQAIAQASAALGRKFDILGSDACLMGMVEIASEMKESVHVYLGSQELEPGKGWPYDQVLARWVAKPQATAPEVARILTEEYVKSYQGGTQGRTDVTFSAFDLNYTDRLHQAMRNFGAAIRALPAAEFAKVKVAGRQAMNFYYNDYRDLLDFADQLVAQGVAIDPAAIAGLKAAARDYIVINLGTPAYARAYGIAFWLPQSTAELNYFVNRYSQLQFDRATDWSGALRTIWR